MKRVQDLIVAGSYDNTLTLANFATKADGAVNIIDPATGVSWASGGETMLIARVCSDSDGRKFLRQSLVIHQGKVEHYVSKDFTASTPKVIEVDVTALTGITVGNVYELFITDYADAQYIVGRRRISYEAKAGDTPTLVAAGLATAINNDSSMPNVTATDAAGVVTITGAAVAGSGNVINNFRSDYEINFNVALAENLSGVATQTTTQTPSKGCGTYREIRKLEEVYKGYRGYINRVIYPTSVNIQYDSAVGSTYDVSTIMHKQPFHTNLEGDVPAQVSTVIAFVEGVDADTFEAALDVAIAELK